MSEYPRINDQVELNNKISIEQKFLSNLIEEKTKLDIAFSDNTERIDMVLHLKHRREDIVITIKQDDKEIQDAILHKYEKAIIKQENYIRELQHMFINGPIGGKL